jgi:hypothetical protein
MKETNIEICFILPELPPGLDPSQNALLKKLLAKSNAAAAAAAAAAGHITPQSDNSEVI